jgi:hypothetical protein
VIAKRSRQASVAKERLVYQEVLPAVPVPALRCYGSVVDSDSASAWIFLEEAGGEQYSPGDSDHRRLVAAWLGQVHTATASMDLSGTVAAHGPGIYLDDLEEGRDGIASGIPNPALDDGDTDVLQNILDDWDVITQRRDEIRASIDDMPRCLVHADFVAKNVRIESRGENAVVWVMDWDIAGWGAPAPDMEKLDLEAYGAAVSRHWPSLDLPTLRRMAALGSVLRNIGLIEATTPGLQYEWVDDTMGELTSYSQDLRSTLRRLGWV